MHKTMVATLVVEVYHLFSTELEDNDSHNDEFEAKCRKKIQEQRTWIEDYFTQGLWFRAKINELGKLLKSYLFLFQNSAFPAKMPHLKPMVRLIALLVFLSSFHSATACCSAYQKRIFPVGIKDNKIIAVQMELYRNCDDNFYNGNMSRFSFVWGGTLRLMQQENDSLIELQLIDSLFRFTECECNISSRDSLSKYDSIVNAYYQKGLTAAKELPGFEALKLQTITTLKDADSLMVHWSEENVIYFSETNRKYTYRQNNVYEPVYHFTQLRTYALKRKRFYVITIDNNYYMPEDSSDTPKKAIPEKKMEPDNYFSSYPEWHGMQEDVLLLK